MDRRAPHLLSMGVSGILAKGAIELAGATEGAATAGAEKLQEGVLATFSRCTYIFGSDCIDCVGCRFRARSAATLCQPRLYICFSPHSVASARAAQSAGCSKEGEGDDAEYSMTKAWSEHWSAPRSGTCSAC